MDYYEDQKKRALKIRDSLLNDPGGGVFNIKDKNTVKLKN
jgi:hypothetical protein